MSGLSENNSVRIMVVDDSAIFRSYWTKIIRTEKRFSVVETAENGQIAIDKLDSARPDVVIIDLEMPVLGGIKAIPLLLAKMPSLKIIVASSLTTKDSKQAVEALTVGAADYLPKPMANDPASNMQQVRDELIRKIDALNIRTKSMSQTQGNESQAQNVVNLRAPKSAHVSWGQVSALAIGCSTGGPKALDDFFQSLPAEVQQPIFITQHMPKFFITALAERISRDTGRPCFEPNDGDPVKPGHIYLAPGEVHMLVQRVNDQNVIKISNSPPENYCRPAVDPMFRSLADVYSKQLLAVVLTGMGEDGMRGAQYVVKQGGRVFAQDEASSVVWGMPGAVVKAGLASEVLSLNDMGPRVWNLMRGSLEMRNHG